MFMFNVMINTMGHKHFTMLISRGEVNEAERGILVTTFEQKSQNAHEKGTRQIMCKVILENMINPRLGPYKIAPEKASVPDELVIAITRCPAITHCAKHDNLIRESFAFEILAEPS